MIGSYWLTVALKILHDAVMPVTYAKDIEKIGNPPLIQSAEAVMSHDMKTPKHWLARATPLEELDGLDGSLIWQMPSFSTNPFTRTIAQES